jgi:hypothetical protein
VILFNRLLSKLYYCGRLMRRFGTQILMYEEYTAVFRAESSITRLTLARFERSLMINLHVDIIV